MENNILTQGYTNSEWENFVKGDLINIMNKNNLQKITINDGCGRNASINRTSKGEYKVKITLAETM